MGEIPCRFKSGLGHQETDEANSGLGHQETDEANSGLGHHEMDEANSGLGHQIPASACLRVFSTTKPTQ